jgi:flavin reductase (DIM6/NTAB) family NADH-FMN oxidoreductase RutF
MKHYIPTSDFAQNYKWLIGGVLPRPIALVSTLSVNGVPNLAPFSFFTVISAWPMILAFCPMIRSSDGKKKDTYENILKTKEFVINVVSSDHIDAVNLCSTELAPEESEFAYSGLQTLPSQLVKPFRVKESKLQYECHLKDILNYGDTLGAGAMISGEVVMLHYDEAIMKDGRISTDILDPIGRGAGNDWIKCDHRIVKERLMKMQIQK